MTAVAALRPAEVWHPAAGTVVRGTVLLLPGRGEHPGVYGRFGRRLAFDGYRVEALGEVAGPDDADGLAAQVDAARAAGGPVVLAGSDTGALLALAAAGAARPDALLLSGAPTTSHPDRQGGEQPAWHDELEFYSIKVQDGPLTSRLQNIKVGDEILIGRKPTGTLVLDGLRPGKRPINHFFSAFSKVRRHYKAIEMTSGALLIVIGVLIFTGRLTIIAQYLTPYLPVF